MDPEVHEKDAGARFGEGHEAVIVIAVDGVGIAINDEGGGPVEDLVVLGPAGDDAGSDGEILLFVETFGEEEGAGAELMVTGGVGRLAGEEDDFFGRSLAEREANKSDEEEEEFH